MKVERVTRWRDGPSWIERREDGSFDSNLDTFDSREAMETTHALLTRVLADTKPGMLVEAAGECEQGAKAQ